MSLAIKGMTAVKMHQHFAGVSGYPLHAQYIEYRVYNAFQWFLNPD